MPARVSPFGENVEATDANIYPFTAEEADDHVIFTVQTASNCSDRLATGEDLGD